MNLYFFGILIYFSISFNAKSAFQKYKIYLSRAEFYCKLFSINISFNLCYFCDKREFILQINTLENWKKLLLFVFVYPSSQNRKKRKEKELPEPLSKKRQNFMQDKKRLEYVVLVWFRHEKFQRNNKVSLHKKKWKDFSIVRNIMKNIKKNL